MILAVSLMIRLNWQQGNTNVAKILGKKKKHCQKLDCIKYEWLTIMKHTEPPAQQYRPHSVFIFGPHILYETILRGPFSIDKLLPHLRGWTSDVGTLVLYGSNFLTLYRNSTFVHYTHSLVSHHHDSHGLAADVMELIVTGVSEVRSSAKFNGTHAPISSKLFFLDS